MEKTKSCKRKMRIAIGILLLEFAYMLFMGIGGVHATDETLPTRNKSEISYYQKNNTELTRKSVGNMAVQILVK